MGREVLALGYRDPEQSLVKAACQGDAGAVADEGSDAANSIWSCSVSGAIVFPARTRPCGVEEIRSAAEQELSQVA